MPYRFLKKDCALSGGLVQIHRRIIVVPKRRGYYFSELATRSDNETAGRGPICEITSLAANAPSLPHLSKEYSSV